MVTTRNDPDPGVAAAALRLMDFLEKQSSSEVFRDRVEDTFNQDIPVDYTQVVEKIMDMPRLRSNLESNVYPDLKTFLQDLVLIPCNCLAYWDAESDKVGQTYNKAAVAFLRDTLHFIAPTWPADTKAVVKEAYRKCKALREEYRTVRAHKRESAQRAYADRAYGQGSGEQSEAEDAEEESCPRAASGYSGHTPLDALLAAANAEKLAVSGPSPKGKRPAEPAAGGLRASKRPRTPTSKAATSAKSPKGPNGGVYQYQSALARGPASPPAPSAVIPQEDDLMALAVGAMAGGPMAMGGDLPDDANPEAWGVTLDDLRHPVANQLWSQFQRSLGQLRDLELEAGEARREAQRLTLDNRRLRCSMLNLESKITKAHEELAALQTIGCPKPKNAVVVEHLHKAKAELTRYKATAFGLGTQVREYEEERKAWYHHRDKLVTQNRILTDENKRMTGLVRGYEQLNNMAKQIAAAPKQPMLSYWPA